MHFLERLRAANIKRDKEWNTGSKPLSLAFFANELAGEVGETCNVLKKFDREFTYQIKGSRDTIEHLAEEMSDIIICCDLLGMCANLNYTEAQWPSATKRFEGLHDYSMYGCLLASMSGRIAGICYHFGTHFNKSQLETVARGLVLYTKGLANTLDIDLERQVCTKFNLTSYKLGLQSTLPVEGE